MRSKVLLIFSGTSGVVLSGVLFLWALSTASLRCQECSCEYSFGADDPRCRLPVILLFSALVSLSTALVLLAVVVWRSRRRDSVVTVRREGPGFEADTTDHEDERL